MQTNGLVSAIIKNKASPVFNLVFVNVKPFLLNSSLNIRWEFILFITGFSLCHRGRRSYSRIIDSVKVKRRIKVEENEFLILRKQHGTAVGNRGNQMNWFLSPFIIMSLGERAGQYSSKAASFYLKQLPWGLIKQAPWIINQIKIFSEGLEDSQKQRNNLIVRSF